MGGGGLTTQLLSSRVPCGTVPWSLETPRGPPRARRAAVKRVIGPRANLSKSRRPRGESARDSRVVAACRPDSDPRIR